MADDTHDKSHDATPHRRQEARAQGHVARSQDLASAVLLAGGLAALFWLGGTIVDFFGSYAAEQLGGSAWVRIDNSTVAQQFNQTLSRVAQVTLPILGLVVLVGVFCHVGQVGLLFVPGKLAPDVSRIDPWQGAARIFSLSGAMRTVFGLLKLAAILGVVGVSLYGERHTLLSLAELSPTQIGIYLLHTMFWTSMKAALALVALAVLDYGFQYWRQEQDLRMTTQEMREEMRNLQGDPQIAARRKTVQRQLLLNRVASTVPKADVVITTAEDTAVAIRFRVDSMAAPVVVAKGNGPLAGRIRRLAADHRVPTVEKPSLAQSLFASVEINRAIPREAYAEVADVLAHAYRVKQRATSN